MILINPISDKEQDNSNVTVLGDNIKLKKMCLFIGLILNLALLFYYKYNFTLFFKVVNKQSL